MAMETAAGAMVTATATAAGAATAVTEATSTATEATGSPEAPVLGASANESELQPVGALVVPSLACRGRVRSPVAAEFPGMPVGVAVQTFEEAHLRAREPRVPHVDDENEAIVFGVVPRLMFEEVVEHKGPPLLPASRLVPHPDRALPIGHRDAEVAANPEVRRAAMGADVGPASHP